MAHRKKRNSSQEEVRKRLAGRQWFGGLGDMWVGVLMGGYGRPGGLVGMSVCVCGWLW